MKPERVKHLLDPRQREDWSDWKWQLRHSPRRLEGLLDLLPALRSAPWMEGEPFQAVERAFLATADLFRFSVTPYYLSLADPENPHCPILRQILPDERELNDPLFFNPDPLKEEEHSPLPGLVHRYPDRALWYLTGNCAVYCRFCTRKRKVSREGEGMEEMVQETDDKSVSAQSPLRLHRSRIQEALSYIAGHQEIKEVILSGGDPLFLSDDALDEILGALRSMEHLYSIRIHSRMPATLPMRITEQLADTLRRHFPLTLVAHFNHPVEVTEEAASAVRRLRMAGVTVLNQSVLLKGINDSAEIQERLLLSLLKIGVKPYYLHQCDEVRGVSHFRTPIELGREILGRLRGKNPGIALPRFMIDLPGGGGKVPLEVDYRADSRTVDGISPEGSCCSEKGLENEESLKNGSRDESKSGGNRRVYFRNSAGTIHQVWE